MAAKQQAANRNQPNSSSFNMAQNYYNSNRVYAFVNLGVVQLQTNKREGEYYTFQQNSATTAR